MALEARKYYPLFCKKIFSATVAIYYRKIFSYPILYCGFSVPNPPIEFNFQNWFDLLVENLNLGESVFGKHLKIRYNAHYRQYYKILQIAIAKFKLR